VASANPGYQPGSATITLAPGDAEVLDITVTKEMLGMGPIDVYFLIGAGYEERGFVIGELRSTGSNPITGVMNAMLAANPNVLFGAGSYINKPLPGIGWNDYHVYQPLASVGAAVGAIQTSVDTLGLSLRREAINKRSSLEAIYQVILRSDTLGFRPGVRRVVFVLTESGFNVAGEANSLLYDPMPITNYNGPPATALPANDHDVDLESACVVAGNICKSGVGWVANPPPAHIDCLSCGFGCFELRKTGSLTFGAGACEDYPSVVDVTGVGGSYEVWAYVYSNWASHNAQWQALTASMASGSTVFTGPASGLAAAAANLCTPDFPGLTYTSPLITGVVVVEAPTVFVASVTFEAVSPASDAHDGPVVLTLTGYPDTTTAAVSTCAGEPTPCDEPTF
jgi:hypothetical protein